jgi:nucleotide-binding universal stress UspA family protein
MYERILIPLDGSATAEAALAYAALLSSRSVRLLAVQPNILGPIRADPSLWHMWQEERKAEAAAYLERTGQFLESRGRTVEATFRVGDPTTEILAGAEDADLIIMTTQGRGTAGRALFGSVADSVTRQVLIPTLLVRTDEHAVATARVTRIVVPLDGSTLAEQALPVATTVATDLDVPVHLIRVLDREVLRATVRSGGIPVDQVQRHAVQQLAEHVAALENENITATVEVLVGIPAAALLDAIRRDDLVVMTTHGRGGIRRWLLGSVADKLVRAAAAPVLLVHGRAQDARGLGDEDGGWTAW